MKDIDGEPMLAHVVKRVAQLGYPLVVAWPELEPEWDVLTRFVRVANRHPDVTRFIRVTADCPLWDAEVGRQVLAGWRHGYYGTCLSMDGLDTEVFDRETLMEADEAETGIKREHVTVWMRANRALREPYHLPGTYRWSVDDQTGLDFVRAVMAACEWCRRGTPHHQNSAGSIAGPGRTPRWDLHQVDEATNRGGLVECRAYDIRMAKVGGPVYNSLERGTT